MMFWIVDSPQTEAASNYLIEINKSTNQLILYQNGIKYKTYPIATGKTDDLTPEGTFHMVVKIKQPGWKHIPGGAPDNPLGDRWLGIRVNGDRGREYGMHGTNQPSSIGTYASNGCVRMRKDDLHELYETIPEGTPVWIHKNGPSTGKWEGDISYLIQPFSATGKIKEKESVAMTGPSPGAFEVEKLNQGTDIEIIGQLKDWYQIKRKDQIAFLPKQEVNQVKSKSTTSKDPFKPVTGMVETKINLSNIRNVPSATGSVVQRVNKGVTAILTGENKNWYRVRLSTGYVAFMHKSIAQKSNKPAPQPKKIEVKNNRVNIRSTASHQAPIIKTVNQGETFQTLGLNGEWYIIPISSSQTGFIHKTLVQ